MVVFLQPNQYDGDAPEHLREHFNSFEYELSDFQKHAIQGIVDGQHTLSSISTGAGKTTAAIFAIKYFAERGLKTIMTTPIKCLSNTKYHDFTQRFPDLKFGLITGDIKLNTPDADCTIVTAEILTNTLHRKSQSISSDDSTNPDALLSFDIDFDKIGAIIHDEIHYILDDDRGMVWEQSIMMTPPKIQLIMLSATIDSPERFCNWIENRHQSADVEHKQVYLACSNKRPVPLSHAFFVCTPQAFFKTERNKEIQEKVRKIIDKTHTVVSPTNVFDEVTFNKVNETLKLLDKHRIYVKRSYVLNELCKHLVEHDMLPSVVFILSKKQIEVASREISVCLLGPDDPPPAVVEHACDQLLRSKLPNHAEFSRTPEYILMVSNMQKGIACHHSGVHPILREMVEILFPRFVKLLFATETVATGVDLNIRTTVFTSIRKYDKTGQHMIPSYSYKQMAGRAGRRGKDVAGTAIHLVNLYRDLSCLEFKTMALGGPKKLTSKFYVSYSLLLNLLGTGIDEENAISECVEYCSKSMVTYQIEAQKDEINQQIAAAQQEIIKKEECIKHLRTPLETIYRFHELEQEIPLSKNKKRKLLERELLTIKENKYLLTDAATVKSLKDKQAELQDLNNEFISATTYLGNQVGCIIDLFKRDDYISSSGTLTLKGNYAANIREAHSLVFAEMLTSPEFASLESCDLAVLFSCFAGLRVSEDDRDQYVSPDEPADLKAVLKIAADTAAACADFENTERVYASRGDDSDIQFDLMSLVREWYAAEDEPACKLVVQRAQQEKGILLGEFTKAITKIVNIAAEVERVAEFAGDLAMVGRLRDVSKNLLKFVVTNQSLYV